MPLPTTPSVLHIVPNGPGVPDSITFVGHRIDLNHVLDRYHAGMTADEIAQEFDTLPLANIQAAIAYYEQHRAALDIWLASVHHYLDHERQEYERQHPEVVARQRRILAAIQQRQQP